MILGAKVLPSHGSWVIEANLFWSAGTTGSIEVRQFELFATFTVSNAPEGRNDNFVFENVADCGGPLKMVYAFIIHTLLPPVPKILYSCVFGSETIDSDIGEDSVGGIRSATKEQIVEVALEIQSQYNFRTSVSGRSYEANMQALQNEGTLPELELGFVRFPCGRQAGSDGKSSGRVKTAVWLGALNCAFVLLCDAHENRVLAEHALKVLVKHLHEHCRVFHQPADVPGKVDRVALVLNQFLPGGQLLVMNHRLLRQFEKELDVKIKQFS